MTTLAALKTAGVDPAVVLRRLEAEQARRRSRNRLADYRPYPKQRLFHDLGLLKRERLFRAGNQLGKTTSGGSEAAMHLTGRYPSWWKGRRFNHPTVGWVGGVTAEATRDGAARILLGRGGADGAGALGTGTIPADCIIGKPLARQGVAEAVAMVRVKHVSGGVSILIFKSYDQGREKWQSDTVDFVWFDEEPPLDIYTEGVTRTNAGDEGRGGIAFLTFTPLLGMSLVVGRFLKEVNPDRADIVMTIDDVEHYTAAQKATIIASYPPHEREARANGIPTLGAGRIFPVTEDSIRWEAVPLPKHFRRIAGLDFGWDHPTAAVWLSWNPDADIIYVTDCYRVREQTPVIHAAAIKARGTTIPVAWPHDGLQHDKGSGEQLAQLYRQQGVAMLPERASFPDGSNGVEAGVTEMLERMQTGRWKVASHLTDWFEEFRLYHREASGPLGTPKIVKVNDDLMDASRYAMMSLRFSRAAGSANDPYARAGRPGGNSWMTA